jgi:hypothetical protein
VLNQAGAGGVDSPALARRHPQAGRILLGWLERPAAFTAGERRRNAELAALVLPQDPDVQTALATALCDSGAPEQAGRALASAEQVLGLLDGYPPALAQKARALALLGRGEAKAVAREAVDNATEAELPDMKRILKPLLDP